MRYYFVSDFSHLSASQVLVTQAHKLGRLWRKWQMACKAPCDTLSMDGLFCVALRQDCWWHSAWPVRALCGEALVSQRSGLLAQLCDFDLSSWHFSGCGDLTSRHRWLNQVLEPSQPLGSELKLTGLSTFYTWFWPRYVCTLAC